MIVFVFMIHFIFSFGLVWFWFGLFWSGFGLVWSGLVWFWCLFTVDAVAPVAYLVDVDIVMSMYNSIVVGWGGCAYAHLFTFQ